MNPTAQMMGLCTTNGTGIDSDVFVDVPANNLDDVADASEANKVYEIILANYPGDPMGEIQRFTALAGSIVALFDAANNNDTEALASALLKYESDNDADANVGHKLMRIAGKHANIDAIGLIYDAIPASAMYLLTAAVIAADANTHVTEIIFWYCHDHCLATKNLQAEFATDLISSAVADELLALSISAQAFIQSYCFTNVSRTTIPAFRRVYTSAERLQEVIDDSDADPDIVRCAYTQDLLGLTEHIRHAQPRDIYHIFWWAGFHANAPMIDLVIDAYAQVPMKIYTKLYAVLQGLSQADSGRVDHGNDVDTSNERVITITRIVASFAWLCLPTNIIAEFTADYVDGVPLCTLFCPGLLEQLKRAPNKLVYRAMINQCLCGA